MLLSLLVLPAGASGSAYTNAGWVANSVSGRLSYPPLPETAPQVFGPDQSCSGGACGTGAASIKLPQAAARAGISAPSTFTPPNCSSADSVGCVTIPHAQPSTPGLTALSTSPSFTSGLTVSKERSFAAWGDFTGDGAVDLYIGKEYSSEQNELYVNDGYGGFTSVTGGPADTVGSNTQCAAWADVDGDGHLDLFVGNGRPGVAAKNELWINDGDGSFTPKTGNINMVATVAYAAAWGDANGDG